MASSSTVDTSRTYTYVRVDRIAQPSHAPELDLVDPKLWNRKGPSLSWEITKMGRTSGGIRRRPGSVRLWVHTMELEGGLL